MKLSGYQQIISQATGVIEPKQLDEIEQIMRDTIFHSTLDWQTRSELMRGARQARAVQLALRRDEMLRRKAGATNAEKAPTRELKALSKKPDRVRHERSGHRKNARRPNSTRRT
jgi:hypothetical protein